MASTNKTANLGLNQWIGTDIPKWEDHNEDNRKIDSIYEGVTSPPRVSETTGNWEVYDWTLAAYVDTGVYAGGTSLQIKGTYATLADLQAAVTSPAQGDMYNVGTAPPYNIYLYDNGAWVDQGVLQGEKGDTGNTGPGVPVGGTTGQKLVKASANDFNTNWVSDLLTINSKQANGNLTLTPSDIGIPVESGTWTPTFIGGLGGTPTYSTQRGSYVKIGNLCSIAFMVQLSSKGGLSGALSITGLPFASYGADNAINVGGFGNTAISMSIPVGTVSTTSIMISRLNNTSKGIINLNGEDVSDYFYISAVCTYRIM